MERVLMLIKQSFGVLKEASGVFWGNAIFMIAFYLCLGIILCFEKKKTRKYTIGGYSILVLLGLYNPVTFWICRKIFVKNQLPYFCRLFSLLPVGGVISYASTLVLEKINGWKKLAVCLIIVFCTVKFGNCVYQEKWIQKAENPQKFSDDVIQVADAVHGTKKNVCIAVPDTLSTYIRQYDASLIMPYGRPRWPRHELLDALSKETIDINNTLRYAGEYSCDYIVVNKNDDNMQVLLEAGQEFYAETNKYLIFKLHNIKRIEQEYNEKKQIIKKTSIGTDDKPYNEKTGYASIAYTYDSWGFRNSERYYDEKGNPVKGSNDAYGLINEWDYRKLLKKRTYIGIDGNPVMIKDGYSSINYNYDKDQRKSMEQYFDTEGVPVNLSAGNAGIKYEYDSKGRISKKTFIDSEEQPVCIVDGYAHNIYGYDDKNNINYHKYLDVKGLPVLINKGYAEIHYLFDENNRIIREEYYGVDGKPQTLSNGCARVDIEYDENGNASIMKYYDSNGKPVLLKNGYSELRRKYNEKKQVVKIIYIGTDGMPVGVNADNHIAVEISYDDTGKAIKTYIYE